MPQEQEEVYTAISDINILHDKGFALGKLIGEGSYAKVFKATQIVDETRSIVLACKVIDTLKAPRNYLTKFLPREMDVLIRINHPHIIQIAGIFQRRNKYFIFLKYAENGDLLEFLTSNGAVSEQQCKVWMRQIFLGVEYLHTLHIAHRDLKCENILITANYNVKITDFGFSRIVTSKNKDLMSETYCGSLSYASPEVLRGSPYLPKPSDMWSLGIIQYTMLNKALPFNETTVKKLYEKQMMKRWKFRSNVVNNLSTECKALVTSMLDPDSKSRPTATEAARSDWIIMDPKLAKLSVAEQTYLQRAKDSARRESIHDEAERLIELRRRQRGKDGLKVLKPAENEIMKSLQLLK